MITTCSSCCSSISGIIASIRSTSRSNWIVRITMEEAGHSGVCKNFETIGYFQQIKVKSLWKKSKLFGNSGNRRPRQISACQGNRRLEDSTELGRRGGGGGEM